MNRGFGDLLQIGNQARPRLFDLDIKLPAPLYERVFEIAGRVERARAWRSKRWMRPRRRSAFTRARSDGLRSCAIALMHAWKYPEQERRLAALARAAGI